MPSSDKLLLQPKYVIKAEKMRRKERHWAAATWVSASEIIQRTGNSFRSFQAVVLSYKWKHNNSVGASWATGGSRTSNFESQFHMKPTLLPSLSPLAVYLPPSNPFSLQIQPTSLHVTALRAVISFSLSFWCFCLFIYFAFVFDWDISHLQEEENKTNVLFT